jgi:Mg-chelatase subunit ChlD
MISPFPHLKSLRRWTGMLFIIILLFSQSGITLAAPPDQTEITTQSVLDALAAWFSTFGGREFVQRGWVTIGDLSKAKARLDQWDVEAYIDPGYLSETGAAAAYVDYTNAGLGYFNDLVFATQPASVPGATVWHEVMHAIFDAHDSDLLVTNDEIYTWYMEAQVVGLGYLAAFETELKSPDCDPQQLERAWNRYERFVTTTAVDYGGYGAIPEAGKGQLAQLTGFQVPDPATLRGLYESSGLIEKCGKKETQSSPAPQPTTTQRTNSSTKATASRLFLIDNSGSMDGERITAAVNSAQATLSGLSPTTEVAVQFFGVYGCDVVVVQDFTLDHASASQAIAGATAWGDTPLAAAIAQGGSYMRANASTQDKVMILLSDGMETCDGDPVEAARGLNSSSSSGSDASFPGALIPGSILPGIAAQGSGTITLHVVGLGIEPGSPEELQLQAIAEAGLGNYYQAEDEIQLTEALQQASEDAGTRRPISRWVLVCGGSLVCLGGLALLVVLVVLFTRSSKKAAGELQPPADPPPTA